MDEFQIPTVYEKQFKKTKKAPMNTNGPGF